MTVNIWDIVLIAVIVIIVVLAVLRLRKNKKQGRPCCGDCAACGQNCPRDRNG